MRQAVRQASGIFGGKLYPNRDQHLKLLKLLQAETHKEYGSLSVLSKKSLKCSQIQINQDFSFGKNNDLYIKDIGFIKTRINQLVKIKGSVSEVIITNSRNTQWEINVRCETNNILIPQNKWVGIDFGIKNLLTLSDGTFYEFDKNIKRKIKTLREYRNKFIKKNASHNFANVKDMNYMTKIINHHQQDLDLLIKNFVRRICYSLTSSYDHIAIEDVTDIDFMKKQQNFLHYIYQHTWAEIKTTLKEISRNGITSIYEINPNKTTQMCSRCGAYIKKTNKQRRHICSNCGLDMDRDQNAALNILHKAQQLRHPDKNIAKAA